MHLRVPPSFVELYRHDLGMACPMPWKESQRSVGTEASEAKVVETHDGVRVKRAYQEPEPSDGYRVLVDRLWPRGVKKEYLRLDEWLKEVAPSPDLRRWFGHDSSRWEEFRRRYRAELSLPERRQILQGLADRARRETVTLVYGARDEEHNGAVVLREVLEEMIGRVRRGAA